MAGGVDLHFIQAVPGDPDLCVISEVDARLEALQNTSGRQIWCGPATREVIQLQTGDTVLDIGANVGSFARLAARMVGPSGRVFAVEPLPQVFEALHESAKLWNAQSLHASSAHQTGTAVAPSSSEGSTGSTGPTDNMPNQHTQGVGTIIPLHCGIVDDPSLATADFTYYPRCTAFSTLASLRDDEDALAATLSIVQNDPAPPSSALQQAARLLARVLPHMYSSVHSFMFQSLYLSGAKTVTCPVTTVSKLMDDLQLRSVALLKINVERGELGVLRSVLALSDWQRIEQVSMQLHNRNGALEEAVNILKQAGQFDIVHHFGEPRFKGCCLLQVVAKRSKHTGIE